MKILVALPSGLDSEDVKGAFKTALGSNYGWTGSISFIELDSMATSQQLLCDEFGKDYIFLLPIIRGTPLFLSSRSLFNLRLLSHENAGMLVNLKGMFEIYEDITLSINTASLTGELFVSCIPEDEPGFKLTKYPFEEGEAEVGEKALTRMDLAEALGLSDGLGSLCFEKLEDISFKGFLSTEVVSRAGSLDAHHPGARVPYETRIQTVPQHVLLLLVRLC